jgi:predicted peptidase
MRASAGGQSIRDVQLPASGTQALGRHGGMNFLLYAPTAATDTLPLLVFLHGAGESGSDPSKLALQGPPKLVLPSPLLASGPAPEASRETLRTHFAVLSPQSPSGDWTADAKTVLELVTELLKANPTLDPTRVCVPLTAS